MCFNMGERAGGRHRLSTCFYIRHTVAVLRLESLLQLAFFSSMCMQVKDSQMFSLFLSNNKESSLLFYHAALMILIQICCF